MKKRIALKKKNINKRKRKKRQDQDGIYEITFFALNNEILRGRGGLLDFQHQRSAKCRDGSSLRLPLPLALSAPSPLIPPFS